MRGMTRANGGWMPASQAARVLGVRRETLYAYVSRGLIRSQAAAGKTRERRYASEDVARLQRRTAERRDPGRAAAQALQWGLPILESAITLIDDGAVYYRGHDAVSLASTRSIEEVAALIWTGRFDASVAVATNAGPTAARDVRRDLPFVDRAQSALAAAAARDPLAYDLRPDAVARTGWRILSLLARCASPSAPPERTIDRTLARAWGLPERVTGVLRAALILCADHELNVSSFTARCVASAGSSPYAVVMAGLAALEGTRHGGMSARVESMLAEMRRLRPDRAIEQRLRRGEAIDGFGHPVYPAGDPRASALLAMLRERHPASAEMAYVDGVARTAASLVREKPTLDFALAATARVLRLPQGAPLMLFAIGRTIGWIGHAIEQYATGQVIRPRARYVGVVPATLRERPSPS
jgi:citrate synthase